MLISVGTRLEEKHANKRNYFHGLTLQFSACPILAYKCYCYNCLLNTIMVAFSLTVDNVRKALPRIPTSQPENDDDMGDGDYQMAKDWSPKGQGGSGGDNKK